MALLEQIQQPNDIKKIPEEDYGRLAQEIRHFLVEKVSVTGGHLASNLGAVELTMALHLSLDLPRDRIIWDVGHQSYTHKLLTGRREGFDQLRQLGGMSGFPKRCESDCDCFDTGHSSTSISAALGIVRAGQLRGEERKVAAVIGDGAMTGGLAYEALNNVSRLSTNLIIILNDNNMSISRNVGGLPGYLRDIRTSSSYIQLRDRIHDSLHDTHPRVVKGIQRAKQSLKSLVVPGMFFEDMGITYLGPIDGHNIRDMVRAIEKAKKINKAVLIHVCTKKGKGYGPAEKYPEKFHGTPPFNIRTGAPLRPSKKKSYTDIFSSSMLRLADSDSSIVAITAAMEDGVGLSRFHNRFPERFFDVGIAEQHAVTFAAGLAAGGMKPVVAVYSTFLQRAYDQIVSDVCLQQLPVVFAVDRAGIVGADGETHQGIFDLSYLSSIPGLTVMAPKNGRELSDMLAFALSLGRPAAIRYPRGTAGRAFSDCHAPIEEGRAEMLCEAAETPSDVKDLQKSMEAAAGSSCPGAAKSASDISGLQKPLEAAAGSSCPGAAESACGDKTMQSHCGDRVPESNPNNGPILLLAVGSMVETAQKTKQLLASKGINCAIANARFVSPLDTELLKSAAEKYSLIVTMEENVTSGGFGEHVASWYADASLNVSLLNISIPDGFVTHGSPADLSRLTGIDAQSVTEKILKKCGRS